MSEQIENKTTPPVLEHLIKDQEKLDKAETIIFSGGASNFIEVVDGKVNKVGRNKGRDQLNQMLEDDGIDFYDPQIHPDTHGEEYNYDKHYPLEVGARQKAKLTLYEINDLSLGGVTMLEVINDSRVHPDKEQLAFMQSKDTVPAFTPPELQQVLNETSTLPESIQTELVLTHYAELLKNANSLRKYLSRFVANEPNVEIVSDATSLADIPADQIIELPSDRLGGKEVLEGYTRIIDPHRADKKMYILMTENKKLTIPDNPVQIAEEKAKAQATGEEDANEEMIKKAKEEALKTIKDHLRTYIADANDMRKQFGYVLDILNESENVHIVTTANAAYEQIKKTLGK